MIPQSASVLKEETRISNEWLAKEIKEKIDGTFYIAAELKKVMYILMSKHIASKHKPI